MGLYGKGKEGSRQLALALFPQAAQQLKCALHNTSGLLGMLHVCSDGRRQLALLCNLAARDSVLGFAHLLQHAMHKICRHAVLRTSR